MLQQRRAGDLGFAVIERRGEFARVADHLDLCGRKDLGQRGQPALDVGAVLPGERRKLMLD